MHPTAQRLTAMGGGLSLLQSNTQKPAESSPVPANSPQVKNSSTLIPKSKQCMDLLKVRCQAVAGSLDMLTAYKDPSVIGSQVMLNDAEDLLETAKRLYEALSENDGPKTFKFTYDGITGLITGSNLDWVLWGGIGFSRSSAKDGLKAAIDSAVSEQQIIAVGGVQ
jgi:hypothetical protein